MKRYIPDPNSDIERFGFEWTPEACSRLVLQRSALIGKKPKTRYLDIYTPRDGLTLSVSPTGRIRVFRHIGGELK